MQIPTSLIPTFNKLLPMHLSLSGNGEILHTGPTLEKLNICTNICGQNFLDLFTVSRPRNIKTIDALFASNGRNLHLHLRNDETVKLKGVIIPDADDDGGLINLSFGIGVIKAVTTFGLTSADFAPNDLTIEMLYLIEAKSAAMDESRKLNRRLQSARIVAEEKAFTDGLTGLKNRRAMDDLLKQLIDKGIPFALMHLDLDYFKAVNDTLGHAAGDHVLNRVAKILSEETRDSDTVARVGGDEFVVILPKNPPIEKIELFANRIIKRLQQPIPFKGDFCHVSVSAGTTISNFYTKPDVDQMLLDADLALYASKHKGRAAHTLYTGDLRKNETAGSETEASHQKIA
ncbi:diguanylate cyclase domain-containing protein [Parasulfitobacter algicola]|uniref:GGDEF domain-containing protein n=1 Tax=Parasulfitobacter algicola TaxID=2614809 RepID=A0ABX2IP38_9RHOB|nr:GGDEF domain-containing protein [Sulfitobacter algicola]NSX54633.1 GGDEF domain-containing protein [Sulfitobacter algicola]